MEPQVDKSKPGQLWVDLQSVVEVEEKCPDCRLYVVCECISSECHVSKTLLATVCCHLSKIEESEDKT